MILLYGWHACSAALLNKKRSIESIWCSRSVAQKLENSDLWKEVRIFRKNRINVAEKKKLDDLLPPGTVHQGIILKSYPLPNIDIETLKQPGKKSQTVVVLDQVTDPQNIGSILRICAVFGAEAVILPSSHAPQQNGVMAKVASGAMEEISYCVVSNLSQALKKLKSYGFWCFGLAEKAQESIKNVDLRGKIALVMGSEGEGMRKLTSELCDALISLPTSNNFSTLNVTMAAAITLYEVFSAQS